MRMTISMAGLTFGILTGSLFGAPPADAGKSTVEQQLRAKYPVVQMAQDKLSVAQQGTILQVNKPRIGTMPSTTMVSFLNTYKDGQIKRAFASELLARSQSSPDLQVGGKVYLVKLDVKPEGKEATVVFTLQTCEACDFTPMAAFSRSTVTFVFPKGAFDSPDMAKIQQTIDEVFTLTQAAPAPQGPAPQPTADPGTAPPPAPAPVSIELGQTADQVVALLGQPDRKATLGPKEIYFYKDMKVTLQNGRVSDVQ